MRSRDFRLCAVTQEKKDFDFMVNSDSSDEDSDEDVLGMEDLDAAEVSYVFHDSYGGD